jgi:hypothetical protein
MVLASLVLALIKVPSPIAPRPRVLVRTSSQGPIRGIRMADVINEVREIWRPYADIDFADADSAGISGYDDDLLLVIADRPRTDRSSNRAALGWIEFVGGRPAKTVTVSVEAARNLMSRCMWRGRRIDELSVPLQRRFMAQALGRSAAHEIGHYLLRSNAHAPAGLMRPQMTAPELMETELGLFRLQPSEIARLERRLAADVPTQQRPGVGAG